MESKRQQKFARLLQKELSEVFQRDVSHLFNGAYLSITTVRVSPDLGVAKIYLSMLLVKNKIQVQRLGEQQKCGQHPINEQRTPVQQIDHPENQGGKRAGIIKNIAVEGGAFLHPFA